MAIIEFKLKKYMQEGDMQHTYSPLRNILTSDNSVSEFNTDELEIDLNHPLSIECQPSYDGTVNLIINDDKNPPRMINTRFSRIENNRYKIITRNQVQQTNLYNEGKIDRQTRLFRNTNQIPKLNLLDVDHFGQLEGGNYTFYLKYADEDGNQTDVVAESGQVSIFHGDFDKISSISGTLQNERTDKSVKFRLSNIDTSYSRFYVYYTREYCDQNGIRLTEAKFFSKPYQIKQSSELLVITGYEETIDITIDELNIKYNLVNAVKTHAQVQNRLFFGNVQESNIDVAELQNLSYYIEVRHKQKDFSNSIGFINENYEPHQSDNINQIEYYSPHNIYYNLGYWPDEMYRLGIVYIFNDDSLSPVFNLRGCDFERCDSNLDRDNEQLKYLYKNQSHGEKNYLEKNTFLTNGLYLDNTFGVFRNKKVSLYHNQKVLPIYYQITLSENIVKELWNHHIKGYFIVRQKRIPTVIAQGLSIGIDASSYIPMLCTRMEKSKDIYSAEGFLNKARVLTIDWSSRMYETSNKQGSALLCLDANVTPNIQSMLDGSQYILEPIAECTSSVSTNYYSRHHYIPLNPVQNNTKELVKTQAIFVKSDTPLKWIHDYGFSTRAGAMGDVKSFGFFNEREYGSDKKKNLPYVRGIYCPIVGVCTSLPPNTLYNIRIKDYSEGHLKEYFQIRGNDNSEFYAISDRYELDYQPQTIDVYRGDCYTNTVTIRLNRNFVDADVPINEIIVDPRTWKDNYKGFLNTDAESWGKINRADLNTVPLGQWVTFKCMSSYNLGLRAFDRSFTDEQALLGNPRGYYPINGMNTSPALKIEESWVLNDGYNATVGRRINSLVANVPYINDLFDNRIMFSNAQVDSAFKNSYRIFQGLSYGDVDRQYGAIVKLIPFDNNLFCVFEHGLAIVPINEKALIQTDAGQSIHMYGAGVIQNKVSLISSDFGSIWPESIVQTPIGIYGVDTYAKKIWRFTKQKGLEIISDVKIQHFLNDNIKLKEAEKYPIISLLNVKSHYNNYKGDVMFTFYNYAFDQEWNLCFNERMDKWVTRYSWTPLYSENINNSFYSLDKKRAEILAHIYDNRNTKHGLLTTENQWKGTFITLDSTDVFRLNEQFVTNVTYIGHPLATDFKMSVKKVSSSQWIDDSEQVLNIPSNLVHFSKINTNVYSLSINKTELEQQIGLVPLYFKIHIHVEPISDIENQNALLNPFDAIIAIIVDPHHRYDEFIKLLSNGFYVHGRAGIIDEMNYYNDKQMLIKPTHWYNKQEPFEFEFVVNEPVGLHKIFNNLVIISNNVQPKELEFEIIGDVYDFKQSGIYKECLDSDTRIHYDNILNQYTLITTQNCKNIKEWGRRLGNIQYKEDAWYTTIEPIICDKKSARIRDKFIKIRVKYSGSEQVIITALKTLFTLSYS